MNLFPSVPSKPKRAYALMFTLIFTAIGLVALVSAMNWTSANSRLTERNNQYYRTVAAAEAATEKVLASINRDYKNSGQAQVYSSLASYRTLAPVSAESSAWNGIQFNNAQNGVGQTYLERMTTESYVVLESQYSGLKGFATNYRIISNARATNALYNITAAVQQDVQLASIPVFQFAIFYNMDLEVNPGEPLEVIGRVHSNQKIYTGGSGPLTFKSDVTSVGMNIKTRHPHDPLYPGGSGSVDYTQKDTNTTTLAMPIGANNTSSAVRAVIEVPAGGESVNSPIGRQRYYNKAELLILVNNSAVTIGVKTPFATTSNNIPWTQVSTFITTNKTFTDQRENKTIKVTEIDIAKFITWAGTNATSRAMLGNVPPNLIYVSDTRSTTSSQLNAVRLINGGTLPSRGLTVSTVNPLYVLGHYNQPTSAHLGTTNTTTTKPASLISDALTILSANWLDSQSSSSYTIRDAASTTINAAILTGIVPTTNSPSRYSGGVQNLGRFLEDWTGSSTVTYNGSMVVMFDSVKATASFQQPGAYYSIPIREIYLDQNFSDPTKLPPGTPELRALIRARWTTPPPNTVTYTAAY